MIDVTGYLAYSLYINKPPVFRFWIEDQLVVFFEINLMLYFKGWSIRNKCQMTSNRETPNFAHLSSQFTINGLSFSCVDRWDPIWVECHTVYVNSRSPFNSSDCFIFYLLQDNKTVMNKLTYMEVVIRRSTNEWVCLSIQLPTYSFNFLSSFPIFLLTWSI